MARLARASEQSIRNWSRDYGEWLSPGARGDRGQRLFDDADVQTMCTIAELRRANVPPDEVMARLRASDVYIDVAPSADDHTTPQQTTPSPQHAIEGPSDALLLPVALSGLQARIEAIEREQARTRRNDRIDGAILGATLALAFVALVVWWLWLWG